MEVKGRTLPKIYIRDYSLNLFKLNMLGESKFKKQNCDVVNLQLQKTEYDDLLTISALTFPVIFSPLALPLNVSTSYAHLDGLELADEPCTSARSIDLLIGSDYYWNFVTGETKRGVKGPITINSKFGWLLSGPINGALDQGYVTYSNLIIKGQYPLFQPNANDVLANSLKDSGKQSQLVSAICQRTKMSKTNHLKSTSKEMEIGTKSSCLGRKTYSCLPMVINYASHVYDPCITSFVKNRHCCQNMIPSFKIN